jgi:hypothetical protein
LEMLNVLSATLRSTGLPEWEDARLCFLLPLLDK